MKKKLVLVLAVMMVLAMVPTVALAEELPKEEGSVVTANSDVSYTIYIPPTVDLGTLTKGGTKSEEFKVEASGVLLDFGGFIDLTARGSGPDGTFRLYDQNGLGSNALGYELRAPGGSLVAPNDRYARIYGDGKYYGSVGVTNAVIPFAGSYKGFMTFTISYQGPVEDPTLINSFVYTSKGIVDIHFKSWKVKDLDSLVFTTFKDGVKVVSAELDLDYYKGQGHENVSVNCPFVADDYWDITYGALSTDINGAIAIVGYQGTTYIFNATKKN